LTHYLGLMTPEELVQTVCPTIGALGAAWYFVPETLARGRGLGLDGFRFYFLGRGGVLGDVEAPVVISAFGYFNPSLVEKMWVSGAKTLAPRQAGRAYVAASHDFGRTHFTEVAGLDRFCSAAEAVVRAADPAALALFAGWRGEPLPEDLPARAMQMVSTLREFRGSAHLLAVVASGISPKMAHYLRHPDNFATFGWAESDVPATTAEDRAALAASEKLTDRLVLPAYRALDDAGREALVTGLERMQAALALGAP